MYRFYKTQLNYLKGYASQPWTLYSADKGTSFCAGLVS